jgi:hypothetical protein
VDGKPPELPPNLPQDLRDFVECRSTSVTIKDGPQAWVAVPDGVKGYLAPNAAPELRIEPGPSPEAMTIKVGLGVFSVSLPATIREGRLSIDTKALPWLAPASIGTGITSYVESLNAWFAANGKGLASPEFGPGEVVLRLVDLPVG